MSSSPHSSNFCLHFGKVLVSSSSAVSSGRFFRAILYSFAVIYFSQECFLMLGKSGFELLYSVLEFVHAMPQRHALAAEVEVAEALPQPFSQHNLKYIVCFERLQNILKVLHRQYPCTWIDGLFFAFFFLSFQITFEICPILQRKNLNHTMNYSTCIIKVFEVRFIPTCRALVCRHAENSSRKVDVKNVKDVNVKIPSKCRFDHRFL